MAQAAGQPGATAQITGRAEFCRSEVCSDQKSGESNSTEPVSNGDIPRIRVGINEVNVVFTVTDKHGKHVTDLKQADSSFVDDNKPAAEIRSFHAETNLPLQVGLLIDASNSVRDRFKFEQESAIEFLNQTIRRGYDQAMVVGFDATPEVTQDFTDDTEKLGHGVRDVASGRRNSAVRRAVLRVPGQAAEESAERADAARDHSAERWRRQPEPRDARGSDRDGAARGSDRVYDQHECERHQGSTETRCWNALRMRPEDGRFFPSRFAMWRTRSAEIQEELRSQYAVSYKPADLKADGHFRTIEIVALDRKNFRVRARRGYYAPAQ